MGALIPDPSTRRPRLTLLVLVAFVLAWLAPTRGSAESCLVGEDAVAKAPHVACEVKQVPRGRLLPMSPVETKCRIQPRPPCTLCRIVKCQLTQCSVDDSRLSSNPAADTVFTRRGEKVDVPPHIRQALIAAALSQSPRFALEVTKEPRESPDPVIRFAAILAAALAIVRSDLGGFRRDLDILLVQLRNDAAALPYASGDVDFLSAHVAMMDGSPGKALAALDAALAKEPAFFAAAALAVKIAISEIDGRRHALAACREGYARMFGYLTRLLAAQPCPRLAVHVENYLSSHLADPAQSPAFLGAQVYLALLARRADGARARLDGLKALPRFSCQAEAAAELEEVLGVAVDANLSAGSKAR